MKQHITVEQLKELKSDDLVCRLNTLMNHEWNITEEEYKTYTWNKILQDTAEYCTIGRMIELLHKKDAVNHHFIQAYHNMWRVNTCKNIELCDALWEAVKALL